MSTVIEAQGMSKSYGNFNALDDISFAIQPGSIVGLIGPNGAGKTTTLKALLGLIQFDGDLSVLGADPRKGRHSLMERVCFIADVGVLPRWLKVSNALDYAAGVHPKFNRQRAEEILAATNIPMNKRVKQLSKGMVTQLHLSLVMAIDVELLILDEPTLGLDILYRKSFYERLLNDYCDKQTSIIISTHQVEEIESLLTHLLFIDGGKIILDSAMDDLASKYAEVLVSPDDWARAGALAPIYSRDLLGKKAMIFEDIAADDLAILGDVSVPSVADLFVAKMRNNGGVK
ncbi:MAG: ABC-2 type transport system ATP-binding protein [Parasphingorhabdus sp.]|jgi:ABC-2 type transport system ATP-binding protein|tara:strand:+ start:69 stop:932 length:864 start_codon:yes stop_codon:yes gene_type:complete